MNRTEERLADALDAVGRSVREETLPLLPARGHAPGPRRWGRWFAPLAAAASVVLVVAAVSAVHLFSGPPRHEQTLGPPRYYATVEQRGLMAPVDQGGIVVRATATGAVTGRIPNKPPGHGNYGRFAVSVAAADGGREFFAAYSGTTASYADNTWLYSFQLTSGGRVTGLVPVPGGVFRNLIAGGEMAVSPDGSKVALTLYPPLNPSQGIKPAEIGVLDLETGTQDLWIDGLRHGSWPAKIPGVSWAADGRSLIFVSLWCRGADFGDQYCAAGPFYGQVRTLRLTPGGGSLIPGRVLLADSRRYPDIVQAVPGPGGKSLIVVVLSARTVGPADPQPLKLRVTQIPLAGGRAAGGGLADARVAAGRAWVLYRDTVDGYADVFLGSDASGRHLLLAWERHGWIDHGRLRLLPPQGGTASADAW